MIHPCLKPGNYTFKKNQSITVLVIKGKILIVHDLTAVVGLAGICKYILWSYLLPKEKSMFLKL